MHTSLFLPDQTYVFFVETFIKNNSYEEPASFIFVYMNDKLKVGVSKLPLSLIRIYYFLDIVTVDYSDFIDKDGFKILTPPYHIFNDNFHQFCESIKEFQSVEFETCLNEKNVKMDLFLHLFGRAISALNYDELYYQPDYSTYNCIKVNKIFDQLLIEVEKT